MKLSHVDASGAAQMADVSGKAPVRRRARAKGKILMGRETLGLLKKGLLKKGDALACARVAGIAAAKKTQELVPLCHNIFIDRVSVDFRFRRDGIEIEAAALCEAKTGIEMEALTAVSVAALTIYDMCKAVDRKMVIDGIHLVEKQKGAAR